MKTSQSHHPLAGVMAAEHTVTHEAITARAREIWEEEGCPENCDEAIWLEAEAELLAIQKRVYRHPCLPFSPGSTNPFR